MTTPVQKKAWPNTVQSDLSIPEPSTSIIELLHVAKLSHRSAELLKTWKHAGCAFLEKEKDDHRTDCSDLG